MSVTHSRFQHCSVQRGMSAAGPGSTSFPAAASCPFMSTWFRWHIHAISLFPETTKSQMIRSVTMDHRWPFKHLEWWEREGKCLIGSKVEGLQGWVCQGFDDVRDCGPAALSVSPSLRAAAGRVRENFSHVVAVGTIESETRLQWKSGSSCCVDAAKAAAVVGRYHGNQLTRFVLRPTSVFSGRV